MRCVGPDLKASATTMKTNPDSALSALRAASSRADAVRRFFDLLDAHASRLADLKHRVEQVYHFETPDRPVFHFDVTGHRYEPAAWVDSSLDRLLDGNLQRIAFQIKRMPESDVMPTLGTGIGRSDLIPRMFGVTFDVTPEGAVLQHFNLIEELPRDLARLQDVDVTQTEPWRDAVERVRFLAEATEGRVYIAQPQMQGPDTNAARLMDQSTMLMACRTHPDAMRVVSNVWADVASRLQQTLQQVAGKPGLMRPRARFYQPDSITAVVVGDYLPFMQPKRWQEIFGEAFAILHRRAGPIFYHTCGPVIGTEEVLLGLPGLAGFETSYVRKQSKRLIDLAELKARLTGRLVLCSFEWALGGFTEDMENFTAEWLWRMSQGGGFMIQDSGPAEEGYELYRRLDLLT
jgi:hypothetical protein